MQYAMTGHNVMHAHGSKLNDVAADLMQHAAPAAPDGHNKPNDVIMARCCIMYNARYPRWRMSAPLSSIK